MRFTKTGPNIPDELIEAQRNGELLFFCGAGVSVPAGLPTFYDLTKNVAEQLHALDDENNEISHLLSNNQFDRTFMALKRIYGDEIVDSVLLKELRLTKKPLLANHENLLKLSINEEKKPFLITTNFDLLFEKVDKKIKSFVPPYLPDLQSKDALSGIVYLHGKWIDPKKNEPNNLIISSQDFGSAYLSHGWATRFLSNLLTRRTVVLIGYSGDDTLVRYLLEGLNSEKSAIKNKIYAFERGEQGKIDQKWSQLGAVGISYQNHGDLWDTIGEWAKYVGDEDKWDEHIFALSQKSPKALEAFERGQVVNFISTLKGVQKFQLFDPLPGAEWIYVFDKNIRLGEPTSVKNAVDQEVILDPINLYGTDIDPSRLELRIIPDDLRRKIGQDYIGDIFGESNIEKLFERLSNLKYEQLWNVDSRVTILARWMVKVAEQPSIIWWVQKQTNLHPLIVRGVEERINGYPELFTAEALSFWKKYILLNNQIAKYSTSGNWYKLKNNVKKKGGIFSELDLENLESLLAPSLILNQSYYKENSYLPIALGEQYLFTEFNVEFYGFESELIDVHSDSLFDIIDILSKVFLKYIRLLNYLKKNTEILLFANFYFPAVNFKNPLDSLRKAHKKIGKIILWIHDLIKKLSVYDEELLHKIVSKWPDDESLIFNRLRLFVWIISSNVNNWSVGKSIDSFSSDIFENRYIESHILTFISEQWANLSQKDRVKVEEKIISYNRIKTDSETEDEYIGYRNYIVGRKLSAIEKTIVGLTEIGQKELLRIRNSKGWNESFTDQESIMPGIQSGWVSTDTSATSVNSFKNSTTFFEKIMEIELDKSIQFERKEPFIGFIKADAIKALDMLLLELEKGNERAKYWLQFFENIDKKIDKRVSKKIGQAILKLPELIIFECRYTLTWWLNDTFVNACTNNKDMFFQVWDFVFDKLNAHGYEATESALGDTYIQKILKKASRKTHDHALNSPIGILVASLFDSYEKWNVQAFTDNDVYILRLEKSMHAIGEGANHAIIMIMRNFNFMYKYYRKWTENNLIQLLDINNTNCEAAWNGFLTQNSVSGNKAILLIKPHIVSLLKDELDWGYSEYFEQSLSALLMKCCYFSYPKQIIFKDIEMRNLIRFLNDDMRAYLIWSIGEIIEEKDNWKTFGRYFFKAVWPKENFVQTGKTSEKLLDLLLENGKNFKDIFKYIEPYFVTIETNLLFLYRLIDDENKSNLIELYPNEVLIVLDKVIGSRIEHYDHYLKEILNKLVLVNPSIKNHLSWRRLNEIAR